MIQFDDDAHTAFSRAPHISMVEDGLKGMSPSSSTQSFSRRASQHTLRSRLATLNVTQTNIESHAKTPPNSPRNTNQNNKKPSEHKLKGRTFTAKKFLQTHTNPLSI